MNLKLFFLLCSALFVLSVLFSPLPAAAQEFHLIYCATHWNFIGPPPAEQAPSTAFCTICDLLVLVQTGFNFIWGVLAIPIAAIMIFYGGFLMIMGSLGAQGSSITKGKNVLKNAFLGLAIVFLAWIGVDSILKIMGAQQSGGKFGPRNTIVCTAPTVPVPLPGSMGGSGSGGTGSGGSGGAQTYDGGPKLTDAGARKFLDDNQIKYKNQCPAGVTTNCVNFSNIKQGTLQTAVNTKACGCEVFISGGTEGGHAGGTFTHGNGDKIDIRRNPQLDAYIQQNYTYAGKRLPGDGAALYVNKQTGAVYAKESSHWDVLNGNSWDVDRRTKQ